MSEPQDEDGARWPHVVIVGGGFGGLTAAQSLVRAPVRVTVVDRTNHHLFQPLLYQVAMAGLSPADVSAPIRSVLRKQANVDVLLAEVTAVDLARRVVRCRHETEVELPYDRLIIACGAETAWFGQDEWARLAPGMKTLDDAVEIRRRVLLAFEAADREPDAARRRRLLTFVVIGGGPTGVELAGALAELARFVLARDFRHIRPDDARVVLVEAQPRILSGFPEDLSVAAVRQLQGFGVEVRVGTMVQAITPVGVQLGADFIPSETPLWTAGVRAAPLTEHLPTERDRAGRVRVAPDCSLPGHPGVFVIGDAAVFLHTKDGQPLPGVSPVAMQQARHVARIIDDEARAGVMDGNPPTDAARPAFRYNDRGILATVGRAAAVAYIRGHRFSGLFAWLLWTAIHIFFLITFRNRLSVMLQWIWSYATYQRGARLVTGGRLSPGPPPAADRRES